MLEVLVAALCIGNFDCGNATKAYYYQNPHLKMKANEIRRDLNYYVGENVAYTSAALLAISLGHKAQIRLDRNWSLQYNKDASLLKWAYSF